jgi:hypothetical protein
MVDIIRTTMALLLVALITGKAVVSALAHLTAWVMSKLAERGVFDVFISDAPSNYESFYMAHSGDIDIEH